MIDITFEIGHARSLGHDWTSERVRHALSELAALYPGGTIDWEEGDENWGRVVCRGETTAYVSARCPLAFVQADDVAAVEQVSSRLGIIAIAVRDFDAPTINVEPLALYDLAERPLTKNIPYDKASVNEIWWATV